MFLSIFIRNSQDNQNAYHNVTMSINPTVMEFGIEEKELKSEISALLLKVRQKK